MKKLLWAALALLAPALLPALAFGQSSPSLYNGQVPTASQWNGYFSSKQDYLGTIGTGVLLRQNGAVLVAPTLGAATGTSLKLGTLTLGTDVLGIAGTGASWGATTTSPGWYAALTGDTIPRVRVGLNATDIPSLAFGPGNAVRDAFIERAGAGALRFGAPDAAAPVSQVLSVQNVVAGTTNAAGADRYYDASQGTGTGLGGKHIFRVAPAGSSGTAQNALTAALTLNPDKSATFGGAISLGGTAVGSNDISAPQWSIRTSDGRALFNGRVNAAAGVAFLDSGQAQLASDLILTRAAAGSVTVSNGGSNSFTVTAGAAGAATFGGSVTSSGFTANGNVLGYSLQSSNANTGNAGGSSLAAAGADKLYVQAHSNNDTATAGTSALYSNVGIDVPTLTATNARTYTNAATVEIEGAPVASTNVTVTNPWALYVRTGNVFVGGSGQFGSGISSGGLAINGNSITSAASMTVANASQFYWSSRTALASPADGSLTIFNNANTIGATVSIPANNVFQHGAADAASPVAQTIQAQSVVAGTSNTAGANFTINGSRGTGTGVGGNIIFQVAAGGSTGTTQNALTNAMTISPTSVSYYSSSIQFLSSGALTTGSYIKPYGGTVASLSTCDASNKGIRETATDSSVAGSGNFGATVTGGGSNVVPLYCDGSAWKIGALDLPAANDNLDLYPGVEIHAAA